MEEPLWLYVAPRMLAGWVLSLTSHHSSCSLLPFAKAKCRRECPALDQPSDTVEHLQFPGFSPRKTKRLLLSFYVYKTMVGRHSFHFIRECTILSIIPQCWPCIWVLFNILNSHVLKAYQIESSIRVV